MRKFATTGALCAIVLTTSLATAKDDFSALLSQLSYDKSPTVAASVPSYKVASNTAVQGQAAAAPSSQNAATSQAISMPAATPSQQVVVAQNHQYAGSAPVAYQQGCDVAQVGCDTGGCASGSCGSGSCRDGSCGEGGFCTPHNQPNLPGSTLRQYWRSNSCNANVWDGYQNKCRKPLFGGKSRGCGLGGDCADGSCDVVVPSQAACDTPQYAVPTYTAQPAACDSGSCDSGACDTNVWSM
jgi:hypothetical protein